MMTDNKVAKTTKEGTAVPMAKAAAAKKCDDHIRDVLGPNDVRWIHVASSSPTDGVAVTADPDTNA